MPIQNCPSIEHFSVFYHGKNMPAPPSKNRPTSVSDDLPSNILETPYRPWPEDNFRVFRSLRRGVLGGCVAGCTSLLLNVVGSAAWPAIAGEAQHPLRLIQVFLTFPLGAEALDIDTGWTLALGCLLYLATGAFYGMIVELMVEYLLPHLALLGRMVVFSAIALVLWVINFYAILSWLQPLLFGGRWILDLIPWWVAAATHVVFGITLALFPVNGQLNADNSAQ